MLRNTKILMIVAVAVWGYLGAFGNIADWSGTTGAVGAATSMATWEGGADSWRATNNEALILLGAIAIPVLKLLSAVLCSLGVLAMWRSRTGGATDFDHAKRLALAGCGIAVLLLFGGWIVIAETWFEMWRSEMLREAALDSAFRYIGSIALIALFVAAPEPGEA